MKNSKEPQIEKILGQLSKEAQPDKDFAQMLQFKLKDKFTELYAEKHRPTSSFFGHLFRFKLRFATATILVLFTSSTIYAYNSDSITNGHILYPLKRSTEKIEVVFARTPEKRANYYNKMAKRRIRELDTLEKRGRFDEETVVEAERLLSIAENEYIGLSRPVIRENISTDIKNAKKNAIMESTEDKLKVRPERIKAVPTPITPDTVRPITPPATITENKTTNLAPESAPLIPKVPSPDNQRSTFAAIKRKEKLRTEILQTREELESRFERKLEEKKTDMDILRNARSEKEEKNNNEASENTKPVAAPIEAITPVEAVAQIIENSEEKTGLEIIIPKDTGTNNIRIRKEETSNRANEVLGKTIAPL